MKTIKLIIAGIALVFAGIVHAQVSVNLNFGVPPVWGPDGYIGVRYYYLPDVEAYYDIPSAMFIYQSGGVWVHRAYLPPRYRHYDLYHGHKVVITDYHGNAPYAHYYNSHREYVRGYGHHSERYNIVNPGRGNSYYAPGHAKGHNEGHGYAKHSDNGHHHGEGHGD